jgi:hypothetical protein
MGLRLGVSLLLGIRHMTSAPEVSRQTAFLALQMLLLRNGAVMADCGPLSGEPPCGYHRSYEKFEQ